VVWSGIIGRIIAVGEECGAVGIWVRRRGGLGFQVCETDGFGRIAGFRGGRGEGLGGSEVGLEGSIVGRGGWGSGVGGELVGKVCKLGS